MNFTLFVTALLTGILFVAVVTILAKLISPRSFNEQKEEPYECGIPTRGRSWMQFRIGYYLFAILFLMFDVETMFLYPWAIVMSELGPNGLYCVLFFLFVFNIECGVCCEIVNCLGFGRFGFGFRFDLCYGSGGFGQCRAFGIR